MKPISTLSLSVSALTGSVCIGWLASYLSTVSLLFFLLIIGGLIVIQVRDLWLVIFTISIHFDDLNINAGFAKIGYGDFGLILLTAYWIFWRLNRHVSIQAPRYWPLMILYVAGVGLSWQQGPNVDAVLGHFIRHVLYVFGYFILVDLIRERRQLNIFLWSTVLATTIHVVIAVGFLDYTTRLVGLSDQPNIFGGLLGPGALIALLFSMSSQFKLIIRLLLMTVGLSIAIAIVLTGSRGAQLALILALLWSFRGQWRNILMAVFLFTTTYVLIISLDPERLTYVFQRWQLEDGSVTERQVILTNTIKAITNYPIFGVGFGQFTQLSKVLEISDGYNKSSHNYYLGAISSLGIPTALILLSFIGSKALHLWRLDKIQNKRDDLLIPVFQAIFIFQSTTLVFRGSRRMIEWSLLALYTALIIIYHRQDEEPSS